MKVLTVQGEELVDVDLKADKGKPLTSTVTVPLLKVRVTQEMELAMERVDAGLIAHMRIPGAVKFDLLIEPKDISGAKGLVNKDVIRFLIGAMFKGK
jgi:hypothetical protein